MTSTDVPTDQETKAPPAFDAETARRVGTSLQLEEIELLSLQFEVSDLDALARPPSEVATPENLGIGTTVSLSDDGRYLGAIVHFELDFNGDDAPYELAGAFRLRYRVKDGVDLDADAIAQFTNYNAVHNAWPYMRELFTSVANRAQVPRVVLPLFNLGNITSAEDED